MEDGEKGTRAHIRGDRKKSWHDLLTPKMRMGRPLKTGLGKAGAHSEARWTGTRLTHRKGDYAEEGREQGD